MRRKALFAFTILGLLLTGCETPKAIVNDIDEREANEIIVFLASRGIPATKVAASSGGVGTGPSNMWNISVSNDRMTDAMALLNANGLPRRSGTSLLDLFDASGMMTSDREQTIRYQVGVAEQLKNMIRKIDGVIDVDVQLAFPAADTTALPGATPEKVTASVYVKHQGVFDDPNNYLEMKIRRLVSGSVADLSYDDVTVVADRSRLTDIRLNPEGQIITSSPTEQAKTRIWSIDMDKGSVTRFRLIFFSMIFIIFIFAGFIGLMVYRFYPQMLGHNSDEKNK